MKRDVFNFLIYFQIHLIFMEELEIFLVERVDQVDKKPLPPIQSWPQMPRWCFWPSLAASLIVN